MMKKKLPLEKMVCPAANLESDVSDLREKKHGIGDPNTKEFKGEPPSIFYPVSFQNLEVGFQTPPSGNIYRR